MACGAIAVKQHAVCAQVAYERMQIVRQLLIVQQCRHQTFALRGAMQNFPRIRKNWKQVGCEKNCGPCGISIKDISTDFSED